MGKDYVISIDWVIDLNRVYMPNYKTMWHDKLRKNISWCCKLKKWRESTPGLFAWNLMTVHPPIGTPTVLRNCGFTKLNLALSFLLKFPNPWAKTWKLKPWMWMGWFSAETMAVFWSTIWTVELNFNVFTFVDLGAILKANSVVLVMFGSV